MRQTTVFVGLGLLLVGLVGCGGSATSDAGATGPLSLSEYSKKIFDFRSRGAALGPKVQEELRASMLGVTPSNPNSLKSGLANAAAVLKKHRPEILDMSTELSTTKPPNDLRTFHAILVEGTQAAIVGLDQMVGSLEKSDLLAFQASVQKMVKKQAELDKKSDTALKKAGYDPEKLESEKKFVKLAK
jgi:hypothetical protein